MRTARPRRRRRGSPTPLRHAANPPWGVRVESPGSYEDWNVSDLKRRAKELGMTGYSDLTKDELVNKLREH